MGNQQPSLDEGTKICRFCGEEKTVHAFKLYTSRGKQYRRFICTLCEPEYYRQQDQKPERKKKNRERNKKYRESNREEYNARNRRWKRRQNDKNREIILEAYGGKCACCGESNPKFLTVDHVNSDGYIERRGNSGASGSWFYRKVVREGCPPCYQLLCYNCNLGRARNGGICPHQEGSETISLESTGKRLEVPTALVEAG